MNTRQMLSSAVAVVMAGITGTGMASAAAAQQLAVAPMVTMLPGTHLSPNAGVGMARNSVGTTSTAAGAAPAVEWTVRDVSLFGAARVASGETRIRTTPSPLPLSGGQGTSVTVRRSSMGPALSGQWRVFGGGASWPVAVSYREARAKVATSLAFGPTISLDAAAGRAPANWITGAAPERFVSAGLSVRFGGSDERHLPTPQGARRPADGVTRLSIRAEQARVVEVYGDWNDWAPTIARRAQNGVWYADVPLARGEYRYTFRVDQAEWRVPEGAAIAEDGFGGKTAFVTVARGFARQATRPQSDR